MRSSTLLSRWRERFSTVTSRNAIHSLSIWRSDFCVGLPSMPTIVRLIGDEVSSEVCASSVVMNSSWLMREVLGSNTRRTAASLLDSSRTTSSTDSIAAFSWVWSALSAFLPALTLGLVISSISSSTFCVLTPGGSSLTTNCHWPRANSSIFQRARTLSEPRPVR